MVLYLNYIQGKYVYDFISVFCGESEWSLLDEYNYAARDPETVTLPKKCVSSIDTDN